MNKSNPLDPKEIARCWQFYIQSKRDLEPPEYKTEAECRALNAEAQADYDAESKYGWGVK